ncbi:Rab escort protein 1 [Linum perenne]
MVDYDQENKEVSKHLLKTKDGVDRLARYQSSIGRFANAYGPFMYPIYGQGELPQAFCRRSAVKGCIYVLRMGLVGLLVEKSSGSYKGIKLASGQELFSDKLVLDPAFTISSPGITPSDPPCKSLHLLTIQNVKSKVVRGICITKSSLKTDISNLLVLYPPRSLYPEQFTTVRVLQLSGNLAVCPLGMFVIYLSALCEDVAEGKKLLNGAMNCLLTSPDHSESSSALEEENVNETTSVEESKPRLLWSALYIQELQSTDQSDSIFSAPTPSEDLDYNSVLDATLEMYRTMYPDSDFFPETPPSENTEENSVENPES